MSRIVYLFHACLYMLFPSLIILPILDLSIDFLFAIYLIWRRGHFATTKPFCWTPSLPTIIFIYTFHVILVTVPTTTPTVVKNKTPTSSKSKTMLEKSKNVLTESKPFKLMVESTFKAMDGSGNGQVNKDELYAGLLMLHLKLAKFAGAAACYVSLTMWIVLCYLTIDELKWTECISHFTLVVRLFVCVF